MEVADSAQEASPAHGRARGLPFGSIAELHQAYRARRASPVELTRQLLARIQELDPTLGSFLTVTAETALDQARQAEREILAGTWFKPLQGVPVAVKDIFDTAGIRTTGGTTYMRHRVPNQHATVVRRLVDAGAILLGKLHMAEAAYLDHHPALPVAVNPWGDRQWAGASCSGCGIAVAAGLCMGAVGSDTFGSTRLASAANGITGLKPTWGRVSRAGALPLAPSLDHVGPMARSAEDVAVLLGVIAGADPADPACLDAPVPNYRGKLERSIAGLRIGIDAGWAFEDANPQTRSTVESALDTLQELGARRVDMRMPEGMREATEAWRTLCAAEAALVHAESYGAQAAQYGFALREFIETGRRVTASDLLRAQSVRARFAGALRKTFDGVDVLLAPVHALGNVTAAYVAQLRARQPDGIGTVLRHSVPFTMSGHPAIVLPGGCDVGGMPIGFQLVGRHLDEALLLRVAHGYQKATAWHRRSPGL